MKLELRHVSKRFGANQVLRDVSLAFQGPGPHFVLGKSGAGKSVLIKQLVGLEWPDEGDVLADDASLLASSPAALRAHRRRCQYVFQRSALFDSRSVLDNVLMALPGVRAPVAKERALAALELVGMVDFARRMPRALGPGLQKRVAIARALAVEPSAVLYDEPTTGLDPPNARRVDRLIARVAQRGITSVVVSHDLRSVRDVARHVTFLHAAEIVLSDGVAGFWASAHPALEEFRGAR